MRYCVNPECPFQVKFRRPAEYQDTATTCSDCGAALGEVMAVPAAAVAASPAVAAGPWTPDLWRRVAVSAAVLVVVVAGNMLPLPGLVGNPASFRSKPAMTLLSVGSSPFLWAMLLVEAAAALIPSWRRLREDGAEGRRRLWRVALGVGLVFATLQSVTSIQYLEKGGMIEGNSVTAPLAWSAPMLMLVLLGGSLFTVLAARVASEAGLGAGFALVVLGGVISDGWTWVLRLQQLADVDSPFLGLAFLGAGVVGAVWLFQRAGAWPPRGIAEPAERPRALPFPVAGMLPVLVGSGLIFGVLGTLQGMIAPLRGAQDFLLNNSRLLAAAEAVIGVNVAIVLGVWCHRPSKVAAAWARWTAGPGAALDFQRAKVGARVRALLPTAIGWNCALVALWVAPALIGFEAVVRVFNLASLVIGISIALDLVAEASARTSGDLATAWTLIRPYEVEPALEALEAAGVQAHARGLHVRATQQFWGVLLPIHVLVPPDQVERARAVLSAPAASVSIG